MALAPQRFLRQSYQPRRAFTSHQGVEFFGAGVYDWLDYGYSKTWAKLGLQAIVPDGWAWPPPIIGSAGVVNHFPNLLQTDTLPFIQIDWPDGGIPRLTRSWWLELAETCRQMQPDDQVLIACSGGTGRTGTMLAILYGLLTGDAQNCVKVIRRNYKDLAVETDAQIQYIEYVLGVKLDDEPSEFWLGEWRDLVPLQKTPAKTPTPQPVKKSKKKRRWFAEANRTDQETQGPAPSEDASH
jgi:hypothetical protein